MWMADVDVHLADVLLGCSTSAGLGSLRVAVVSGFTIGPRNCEVLN